MSGYEHTIWLPDWCFWIIPALWIVMSCVLGGLFTRNMPKEYGPADQLVASALPMVAAIVLSGVSVLGGVWLLSLVGLEFGFRG